MASQSAESGSTAIQVQLSAAHAAMIWPGLDYLVRQFLTQQQAGISITSYPFALQPLPEGYDSGTFSEAMMERISQLWARMAPIKVTGGEIAADEFDLRAAIFAVRTSVDLERYHIRKAPRKGRPAQSRLRRAKRSLKSDKLKKERVVGFLETRLKRAHRRFESLRGAEELKTEAKQWQSHLRWMRFHLAYFKPPARLGTSTRLQMRRSWIDTLTQMAERAIVDQGYALPEAVQLREVIRLFLDYSRRGRMGEYNHIYLTTNRDDAGARFKLFDFVQEHLVLQDAL